MLVNDSVNTQISHSINICFSAQYPSYSTPAGGNPLYWYPIESISSMLGHKSIRTPHIYSKVIKAKVCEDMNKLKRKLSLLGATF